MNDLNSSDFTEARDPFALFELWFAEARAAEINDPEAMALATVDRAGLPDARMVLCKGADERGLVFYTNIESAKGRELADEPRAAALFYGAGDLSRETRARLVPGRSTELYTMSRIVLVARATGLDAIDSPCFDLGQPERLESHTRVGADLGFDGKALIHPSQIEAANRCFTPSPEAVAEARRLLAAYQEAESGGRGALALEGQFIDAVHVHMARETLARADMAAGGAR